MLYVQGQSHLHKSVTFNHTTEPVATELHWHTFHRINSYQKRLILYVFNLKTNGFLTYYTFALGAYACSQKERILSHFRKVVFNQVSIFKKKDIACFHRMHAI